jgi:phage gp29-like protein
MITDLLDLTSNGAGEVSSPKSAPQPNLSTVVRPEARDRFTGLITRGLTPKRVQSILDGAFAGSMQAQFELFDLMEDTWPRLKKNLNEIKRAVVRAEWRAEASSRPQSKPGERAEAKRDFLADAMGAFRPSVEADENGFEQMLYDLCDAVGKGISVQEIHWEVRGVGEKTAVLPRATRWIPSRCYGYPPTDTSLQLCPDGLVGPWQPFPADKFIIALFKTKTGHPIGAGMLRSLAAMWIGSNFSYDWALNLAQLFGLPFRWVEYDPSQTGLLKQICAMLENMGSAGWGAFPAGTKLELKEAVQNAGDSPQAYLMQLADTACDILLLGQTLTTESTRSGSLALGQVHEQIREDVLRYIGHWAATALNYSLVPALMRLNFGDNVDDPYLVCELIEIKDSKAMADRDAVLFGDLGLAAPKKWFYERHSIPMPGPGDETFTARAGQGTRDAAVEIQPGNPEEGAPADTAKIIRKDAAPIQAALAPVTQEIGTFLKTPFALPLPAKAGAKTAPADIQWMPPGTHTIHGTQNGRPVERQVRVDAGAAERLQAALEEMLQAVARDEGDKPYFDFNHQDDEASAWPTEFYWAGDDPKTGGIRARLEWSAPGREAVLGRTYRRFSPSFFINETGEVTGAPVNMGGLVNRAAFRAIQPIWSKDAAFPLPRPNPTTAETETNIPIMKSLLATLANLGFIACAESDEPTAILQVNAKANELLGANAELSAVRAQLQTAQDDALRARKAHAESVVNQAAIDGRIPPLDDALRARWTRLIEQDPANSALLPEPNPALRTVVTARQASTSLASSEGSRDEHPFLTKTREVARQKNLNDADAVLACCWSNPELYDDYRRDLRAIVHNVAQPT